MNLRNETAAKVKSLRIEQKLAQKDLAAKLDCSAALLNQIESNQRPLTLDMAFRIELALGHTGKEISGAIIEAIYNEAGGKEEVAKSDPIKVEIKEEPPIPTSDAAYWLNNGTERRRILGEIIKVPVKLPRDIYLKLEFE